MKRLGVAAVLAVPATVIGWALWQLSVPEVLTVVTETTVYSSHTDPGSLLLLGLMFFAISGLLAAIVTEYAKEER